MGRFSLPELLIIMVVILLLFGAKRIPEIAGSMGKGIREFKKSINDMGNDVAGNHIAAPPPRLTADELQQRPVEPADQRPEPKRLLS